MFASSTGRQVSFEDSRWENGAFTDALMATLNDPEAYGKDGLLSTSELDEQLSGAGCRTHREPPECGDDQAQRHPKVLSGVGELIGIRGDAFS